MPRKKMEGTEAASKPVTTSARTRQKASKPDLDKTPLENEIQQSMKTPVNRVKKSQIGFPDRLNWKMAHLRMPTTSTPKVDLSTKKVTERDVDTAFGFDDSCNGDVGANYSTLISPIAHCSTGSGDGVGTWKINPLTQRNVEVELPKPISSTDQENASERRSARVKTKGILKQKSSRANKPEAVTAQSSSTPKLLKEVAEAITIQISPAVGEVQLPPVDPVASTESKSDIASSPKPAKSDLPKKRETKSTIPKSKSKTTKEKPQSSDEHVGRRTTRARTKPKVLASEAKELDMEVEVDEPLPALDDSRTHTPSASTSVKSSEEAGGPKKSILKTSSSSADRKTSSKKLNAKPTSATTSKVQATTSSAKRKKKPLLPEDTDVANGTSPFSALLEKYSDDKPTLAEGELHVDPKKITRTYGSRKRVKISEDRETEYDFVPSSNVEIHSEPKKRNTKRKPSSKKPSSKTKLNKEDELDEEAEKWLEEKNREFEDVLKVPLVIENSFSSFSD